MARLAIFFGLLLIAVGLVGYFQPDLFGAYDQTKISPTALIPAFIGAGIALCGLLTVAMPNLRKHAMHVAALLGVFGFLGGFMPLRSSEFNMSKASAVSGALLSGICLVFIILCVKSFIDARKARQTL